jgi:hypothetical protein
VLGVDSDSWHRHNRTGTLGKAITANIAMTRIYDHRKTLSKDSPVFKVSY